MSTAWTLDKINKSLAILLHVKMILLLCSFFLKLNVLKLCTKVLKYMWQWWGIIGEIILIKC